MKITSFNPLILTKDAESKIRLFEELGFEKRHSITIDESGTDITTVRMKNADGFCVDISQSDEMQQDMMMIRMNVSDFDEAYQFLLSRGFQNPRGEEHQIETRTNKSACLIAPSGFAFSLCQHIKD